MKKTYTLIALLATFVFTQAQPGRLDPSFGDGGIVTTTLRPGYNSAEAVTVQADGKIIACGSTGMASSKDAAVARYNDDGSLDNTFGTDGKVVIAATTFNDYPLAVAVLPDGKIVIGGYIFTGSSTDVLLIRLNADGTPDNTFGTNGIVITDFGGTSEVAESLVLQPDGKILLGGDHNDSFMVLRYNTDGTLDNTFGTGGLATADVGISVCYVKSIALQDDGKIVAGGMGFNGFSNYGFAMARFNSNGALDGTFADNGTKLFNVGSGNDFISAVAIQTDGKIIAGGHTWIANLPILQYDFAAVRLNENGTIDDTFGEGGYTTVNVIFGGNYLTGMALQHDEKIILSGYTAGVDDYNLAISRLTTDGELDTEFGINGITETDIAGPYAQAQAVALQADGKIVTAGDTYSTDESTDFLIVRYGGSPVGTFRNEFVEFSLYPNPAIDYVMINSEQSVNSYSLMNINGQIIESNVVGSANFTINVSQFSKGIYILKFETNVKPILRKIIIK